MPVATPEWLSQRGGELRPSKDGRSWLVYFAGEPQYLVAPLPADGKYSCRVSQTINGKRLDKGTIQPTVEAAAAAGLDDLRQALGW